MKRAFTLIEVLISLSLLTLLLSTLFFWYHHAVKAKTKEQTYKRPLLEERYADQRLLRIFSRAKDKPYFFTSQSDQGIIDGESLIFTFDHGLDESPLLSNTVLARLYLDRAQKTLMIGLWPLPATGERGPSKTLPLLDNVLNLEFQFYFPPHRELKVDPQKVGAFPRIGWQSGWQRQYPCVPAMMKIILTRDREGDFKERTLEFCYDLPFKDWLIIEAQK